MGPTPVVGETELEAEMRVSVWDTQVGIQCDSCLAWVTQDGTIRRWAAGEDIDAALTREHSQWACLGEVGRVQRPV